MSSPRNPRENAAIEPRVRRDLERRGSQASMPLRRLLDAADLRPVLLAPAPEDPAAVAAARDLAVFATAVIELEEPGRYLSAGDLLLITGLGLPTEPGPIDAYVRGLTDAGVAALVFGLEPVYPAVPEALIAACRRHGLALIELPPELFFVQVTQFVTRELESARMQALEFTTQLARRLTSAALLPSAHRQLIATLAQATDGWVVLRAGGEVVTAGTPLAADPEELLQRYSPRLAEARAFGRELTPTVFGTETIDGLVTEVTAVAAEGRSARTGPRTELLFVKAPRITSNDRTGIMLTVSQLQLVLALPGAQLNALDQLMMQLLTDEIPPERTRKDHERFGRLIASSLGMGRRRHVHGVVAVSADGGPAHAADLTWWRRLLATPFVDHRGDRLRAVVAGGPSAEVVAECAQRGWLLAVGAEREVSEVHYAMREAEALAAQVRSSGQSFVSGVDRPSIGALVAPDVASHYADTVLAPLLGVRDDDGALTFAVLEAWLGLNGSWDGTARSLGLHRNTVRRLVAKAERLLGASLADPVQRAELVIAFQLFRTHAR